MDVLFVHPRPDIPSIVRNFSPFLRNSQIKGRRSFEIFHSPLESNSSFRFTIRADKLRGEQDSIILERRLKKEKEGGKKEKRMNNLIASRWKFFECIKSVCARERERLTRCSRGGEGKRGARWTTTGRGRRDEIKIVDPVENARYRFESARSSNWSEPWSSRIGDRIRASRHPAAMNINNIVRAGLLRHAFNIIFPQTRVF